MNIAIVQIDSEQEQPEKNLAKILEKSREAHAQGAKIILFHEGTLTDYVADIDAFAQEAPDGPACRAVHALARELDVYISFGLIEKDGIDHYITQVFLGPDLTYRYRKTWLYATTDKIKAIRRYRDEPTYFDCGNGPEIFEIGGIRASCIICADANAERCVKKLQLLKPDLVFYPNNREMWWRPQFLEHFAKTIGAPLLVANRVGKSWGEQCEGGSVALDSKGNRLVQAGDTEEIIYIDSATLCLNQ